MCYNALQWKQRNNELEAKQKRKTSNDKDETISTKESASSSATAKKKACNAMHYDEKKEIINQKRNKKVKLAMAKMKRLALKNA